MPTDTMGISDKALQQIERQIRIYGCPEHDLKDMVAESLHYSDKGMLVMSMMSDAQEEIAMGMQENARQTLNRAKWVVDNYLRTR